MLELFSDDNRLTLLKLLPFREIQAVTSRSTTSIIQQYLAQLTQWTTSIREPLEEGAVTNLSEQLPPQVDCETCFDLAELAIFSITKREVLPYATQLLSCKMDCRAKRQILLQVESIPSDQRELTVSLVLKVVGSRCDNGYEIASLIQVMNRIPFDERADVIQRGLEFTQGMDLIDKGYIFSKIADIPSNERELTLPLALSLINDSMAGHERCRLIRVVAQVPLAKRVDVIQRVLASEIQELDAEGRILLIYKAFDPERHEFLSTFLTESQVLFLMSMSGFEQEEQQCLEPFHEAEACAHLRQGLLSEQQELSEQIQMEAEACAHLTQGLFLSEQQELSGHIKHLSYILRLKVLRADLFRVLGSIPVSERISCCAGVVQLHRLSNMSQWGIIEAIESLASISCNDRVALVRLIELMLRNTSFDDIPSLYIPSLLSRFGRLSASCGISWLPSVIDLLSSSEGCIDMSTPSMLERLAKEPFWQIEEVIRCALRMSPRNGIELNWFVEMLLEHPLEEREEVGRCLQQILESNPYFNFNKCALIEKISLIPSRERLSILTGIVQLNALRTMDPLDVYGIIGSLIVVSFDERAALIGLTQEVMQANAHRLDDESAFSIYKKISRIPASHRDSVIVLIWPLLTSCFRIDEPVVELIEVCKQLPIAQREQIIDCILQISITNVSEFKHGIAILRAHPLEEQKEVARSIKEILNHVKGSDRDRYWSAISSIPLEDRLSVLSSVIVFSSTVRRVLNLEQVIIMLVSIPLDERVTVIRLTQQILQDREYIDKGPVESVLERVIRIPAPHRESWVASIFFLLSQIKRMDVRVTDVMEALEQIPFEKREGVIRCALKIINQNRYDISASRLLEIIFAIAEVSLEEFESVLDVLMQCAGPNLLNVEIIKGIAAIAAEERENLIHYALPLFDLTKSDESQRMIIDTISSIPLENRADVFHHAWSLLMQNKPVSKMLEILTTIAQIPEGERGNILRLCREVTAVEVLYAPTICAIAAIPLEAREDVIHQSRPFFRFPINNEEKHLIIEAIARIPFGEREEVVRYALQLIQPRMPSHDKIQMIELVAAARGPEEKERLVQVQRVREEFVRGKNVHGNNRDMRTKNAVELLYRLQGLVSSIEIEQAVEAFISYLDGVQIDPSDRKRAKDALLKPKEPQEAFGPLIDPQGFSLLGLRLDGAELIGRLWRFASELQEVEQSLAKHSMVTALKDAYEEGNARVCNAGKTQRLMIAVLQGRLTGVKIDEELLVEQVSTPQALEMFFLVEHNKAIDTLDALHRAAEQFCDENPGVSRREFLEQIEIYAQHMGIA